MSGHTPGPWQWEETPGGDVRLATPDRGKLYVMGFARKGMRGAQPRFSLWGDGPRERRGGIMHDFNEAGGANHPDARLIAAAPDGLAAAECAYLTLCAHPFDGWRATHQEAMCALRDFIAKATGRDEEDVQNEFEQRAATGAAE